MTGMRGEDLIGHTPLEHRADSRGRVMDGVSLGHGPSMVGRASLGSRLQVIEQQPTHGQAARPTRARSLPTPGARRATVIGAGSFGTALAVLLARAGLRTTLQTRTAEQATTIEREKENYEALKPGEELSSMEAAFDRAEEDYRPGESKKTK